MPDLFRRIILGGIPESPPAVLRRFSVPERTLCDSVVVGGDGWSIETDEARVVRLFEVPDPGIERCSLVYRAALKSEDLHGRAFLEMWVRLPGRGEFFSRGVDRPLKGSMGWNTREVSFRLKKGQSPDLVTLNLTVEGHGRVWIKDIELLKMQTK